MIHLLAGLVACASNDDTFPDGWEGRWVGRESSPDGSYGGTQVDIEELADGRLLQRGSNGQAWVGSPGTDYAGLTSVWDASGGYGAVGLARTGAAMTGDWNDGRALTLQKVAASEPREGPSGTWLLEYESTDWGCDVYHTPWSGTVELWVEEGVLAIQRNGLRVTLSGTLDGGLLDASGVSLSPEGDRPVRETLTAELDDSGDAAVGVMEQASDTGCVQDGAVTLTRIVTGVVAR